LLDEPNDPNTAMTVMIAGSNARLRRPSEISSVVLTLEP
jgi:hypothetical protein